MPRQKYINKTNKKIVEEDGIIAERLREYDAVSDQIISALNGRFNRTCEDFASEFKMIRSRFSKKFLQMTISEVFTISEKSADSVNSISINTEKSETEPIIPSKKSKEDEGYLTEDSSNKASINHLSVIKPILRSAKTSARRSRSACSYLKHLKKKTYEKGFSVDRGLDEDNSPVICRWPKLGEKIISLSGSPIVSSSMTPGSMANVNIPIRNGMVSLKAKRMYKLDENILQNIEPDTLIQIKQLQSNLNYIMNYAENGHKCVKFE